MVTVSSRGQIAISADVRLEMEIDEGTKLLVASEGRQHTPRKVDESTVEDSLEDILKSMWGNAEGLEEEDAEPLVHEERK